MWNGADDVPVPHFRRSECVRHRVDRARRHPCRPHPSQPMRSAFARQKAANECQNFGPMLNAAGGRCVHRIVGQVRPVENPSGQAVPGAVVGAADEDRAVGGFERRRRHRIGAGVAEAGWLVAVDQIVQCVKTHHCHRRIEQRVLDELAPPQTLPREQGGQDGVAGHGGRAHVHDRRAGPHPGAVGFPVHRHEAAFGLGDRVEAQPVFQRAGPPVGGYGAIDKPGVQCRHRVIAKSEFFHHAGGEILQHYVGFGDNIARHGDPACLLEVDGDAALIAVGPDERAALVVPHFGSQLAEIVAAVGFLDFDHFGAEVGQNHAAQGAGDEMAEIGDADAGQRQRCVGGAGHKRSKIRWGHGVLLLSVDHPQSRPDRLLLGKQEAEPCDAFYWR